MGENEWHELPNLEDDFSVETIEREEVKEPRRFQVIFLNDDYTPMEYVRAVLMYHFHKTGEEAKLIALQVHETGKGIAGVYPLDIANTKSQTVNLEARAVGHPLTTVVEPE